MRNDDLFSDVVDPRTKSDNLYLYIDPTIIAASAGAISQGVGAVAQATQKDDIGKAIQQRCGRRAFKFTKKGKRRFDECAKQVTNELQSFKVGVENQRRAAEENTEQTRQDTTLKISLIVGVVLVLVVSSIVILKK